MTRAILDAIACSIPDARPPSPHVRPATPWDWVPSTATPWAPRALELLRSGPMSALTLSVAFGGRVTTAEIRAWLDREVHAGRLELDRIPKRPEDGTHRYRLPRKETP